MDAMSTLLYRLSQMAKDVDGVAILTYDTETGTGLWTATVSSPQWEPGSVDVSGSGPGPHDAITKAIWAFHSRLGEIRATHLQQADFVQATGHPSLSFPGWREARAAGYYVEYIGYPSTSTARYVSCDGFSPAIYLTEDAQDGCVYGCGEAHPPNTTCEVDDCHGRLGDDRRL